MSASELQVLSAGVARVVITPPVGIRMWGYTVQEACSQGVERDLTATVLVLSGGTTTAVLIGLDVLFVPMPLADRIRERISRELEIPPDNVLLNGSHTHLGPMLPGWQEDSPSQQDLQNRYAASLEDMLAGMAAAAWRERRPSRLGTGRGEAPLGVNRREKMPDGTVIIGENPDGPIDRSVHVLRIDELDGRPLAVVMSAACHTVVRGPKTLVLSPDFIGPARELVERATGVPSLFLQGAAGNINPACGIGAGGPAELDDLERMGLILGGETLKVWAQIRTHNRRGPRRIVRSVAALSVWDYEPLPAETISTFSVALRRVTLPLSPLPDRKTVEDDVARYRQLQDEVIAESPGRRHVVDRMLAYAEQRLRLVQSGVRVPTREIEVWTLRINDLALAAISAEPLTELAQEIVRRSPVPHTLVLGCSNGCIGYIPPPEAFAEGGMEVVESHYNYLLASQLTPDWAPRVVETALKLLHQG